MQNVEEIILKTLSEVHLEFKPNELAYLANTTKIELPFRDRWAFKLFEELSKQGLIVLREWVRTDIAILSHDGVPVALIELKAMYAYDILENGPYLRKKINGINADVVKAKQLAVRFKADANVPIYTVVLATLPHQIAGKIFKKYRTGVKKSFKTHGNVETIEAEASKILKQEFTGRNVVLSGKHHGGTAFSVGMDIMYWATKEQ